MMEKLEKRVNRMLYPARAMPSAKRDLNIHFDLGTDELGRDVASGLGEYVLLLLRRNVQLRTLIVLGSRAKGRSKPESDIDVIVIASNLPGRSSAELSNIPQKILNIRRRFLLSDAPIFMGIQPSGCGSEEEFLTWLRDFKLSALDAVYYGKVIYDGGFWEQVLVEFRKIESKYRLNETNLKELLVPL
jgi:hypothetical protein